ncbi:unnamed protein product [Allacma fusca]|uniref:Exoribonuclease phosphorolytic domain-containing protein n=1 Tax=Allacma fusca TaxID=39272 RepID=A0A8J2LJT8_9HEXA|nr:unnamed protein product [Allacma fusca]
METTSSNGTASKLKGFSRADLLNPKLPLINTETGKRQDGRDINEVRPVFVQTGIKEESRGSSYVEYGRTKVICVVQGPRDLSKKIDFSPTGLISVDIQTVGGKVPERFTTLMKDALEAIVILDKFPKAILEVHLTILEDSGSALAACITAAGLALADGGIPVFDIMIGSTLLFDGKQYYFDPTRKELDALDLTEQEINDVGGGIITLGCMPSRDQTCLLTFEGSKHQ